MIALVLEPALRASDRGSFVPNARRSDRDGDGQMPGDENGRLPYNEGWLP